MSDEDDDNNNEEESYEYEYDDDMEEDDGGFDYTDDEQDADENDGQVVLENAYYNAKGLRDDDVQEAIQAFEQVIVEEQQKLSSAGSNTGGGETKKYGEWSYKAMKQLVKLHLRSGNAPEMMKQYHRLLECISEGDISPNAIEKGINGMLERVSSIYQGGAFAVRSSSSSSVNSHPLMDPQQLALAVYDATLKVFRPSTGSCPNERLWFKTNLKYGQLLYETNETSKLQQVLMDLKSIQQTAADSHPTSSVGGTSTQSMEVYALQIQLYSRQKDNKKLRDVFNKAMAVRGGIPHPRTLALIQELGGKMHMAAKEYEEAGKTFFQAFKSYDEAGDPSRLRCLKYLVLASMLHASTINPFDSQEARPYRDDPEIAAMTNLVQAFHNNEIQRFERILQQKSTTKTGGGGGGGGTGSSSIMDDEFVREYIEDLLRTIRTQVLRRVIRPYTRISLAAISKELNNMPIPAVENLLVGLILDGTLEGGQIDQVQGVLVKRAEKGPPPSSDGMMSSSSHGPPSLATLDANDLSKRKYEIMQQLVDALNEISVDVTSARMKEGSALRTRGH